MLISYLPFGLPFGWAYPGRCGGMRIVAPGTGRSQFVSTDAIVMLREDHQELKRVFREFEAAGEKAAVTKQQLVDRMIEMLTVHTYLENECMYPRVRALIPDLNSEILESLEEHHVADVLCLELTAM